MGKKLKISLVVVLLLIGPLLIPQSISLGRYTVEIPVVENIPIIIIPKD